MKYLIKEYRSFKNQEELLNQVLTEQEKIEKDNGSMFLAGVIQAADTENGNGRIYPRHVLEREVKNYMKLVSEKRALGEADHPGGAEADRVEIELKTVSHIMTNLWWNGNELMGKLKVLNTPCGNIIKNLISEGVTLGISSRGLGSTKQDHRGKTIVEDDFQIICWDLVSEPSTSGAFVRPLQEGVNYSKKAFSQEYRINCLLNQIITE